MPRRVRSKRGNRRVQDQGVNTRNRVVTSRRSVNSFVPKNVPASPGDPALTIVVECNIGLFAVAGATYASVTTLNAGIINNFAARFVAFDEYRIVGMDFDARMAILGPGILMLWVEPTDNSAPTLTTASQNIACAINMNDATKVTRCHTRVTDFNQLAYSPIATTTYTIGYLKLFSNSANFGSTNASVNVHAFVTVQFRGFA